MKVLILGAAGPVAQAAVAAIENDHELLLTDVIPISTQHRFQVVDITDERAVDAAANGADAIINCTVIRSDNVASWRVNFIGCFNALKAAAAQGVTKFIQTSPTGMFAGHPGGYNYDHGVDEAAPRRVSTGLYSMTKHLANETCRAFADRHGFQVIVFGYMGFSEVLSFRPASIPCRTHPDDAGQAFRLALEVGALPTCYEFFQITAEWPHEQYGIEKARQLLGFRPKHSYDHLLQKS